MQCDHALACRLVSTLLDLSCLALYSNLQRCDPDQASTYVYKAQSSKVGGIDKISPLCIGWMPPPLDSE